jgi:hypothetical protein
MKHQYYDIGMYEYQVKHGKTIQKAVELLKSNKAYQKILNQN